MTLAPALAAAGFELARLRAECAALAEALDADRHEFMQREPGDVLCGHRHSEAAFKVCWLAEEHPIHRTSARVRAERQQAGT